MKKILIASVLLMVGCVTQEEEYTKAVALAESLLIKSEDLGFGFQAGMTKAESDAHLKKIQGTAELTIKLPNASRLTAELEPQYGANRLAGLYVRLKGDKDILDVDYKEQTLLEYKGLLRMLKTRYGATTYPHKSRNDQAQSWFNGPIEIEAQYSEMYGIRMYYKDLRHYGQYLREFVEQYEREQAADKIRQAKQASRL